MNTIEIETSIPTPVGRRIADSWKGKLRAALPTMKPGDSFKWTVDNRHIYEVAREIGIKIATRKENGGWRVWRIK